MRIAAALALGIIPATALAQDVHGTISGTLDLDPVEWFILESEDLPGSTWSETSDGIEVEIHAYAQSETPTSDDMVEVTLMITGDATEAVARAPRLILAQSEGQDLVASGENIDLQLTNYAFQGDRLVLAGDLVATMTPGGSDELVVEPGADAMTFDGNFQATITASD